MNISSCTLLTKVANHTAAGTTDVESASVDMANFEGVRFFTSFGTAAADNSIKVQQSSDDGVADAWSDLEGTSVVSGASPSNEDVVVDVYRPTKRYVRALVVVDTSSTVESVWAEQYGPRTLPTVQSVSGTIIGEVHASPAEGTA